MGKLDGKVAVITGGASGIGEGAVRRFVEEGAQVVIADIQDERGQALAEELGTDTAYVHTDVGQEEQVKAALAQALNKFGRLDCLFNNAGYGGVSGPIAETDMDAYDATMAVLLRGVVLGMKHAAPILTRQGSGTIISTASVAGLMTGGGPHIYSAAKAAVIHLTRSVAMELGESGVRVNCICPGGIATPIFGKGFGLSPEQADQTIDLLKRIFTNMQPIRRPGVPDDIARAALWLASDDSSFVNGHALVVDGGLSGGRQWSQAREGFQALNAALGGNQSIL